MSPKTILVSIFALTVAAQQTVWGQCGGTGWTGVTTCVSGSVCTRQSDYYSQCLPASTTAATTTLRTSTISATTVRTSTTSASAPTGSIPAGTKYFITFGDSYSQTGFDPNGQLATAANPLGNPTLPGWTSSGGLNWIGDLITRYNISLTLSYNYAYGGATVNASLVAPYESTVLSLIDQVAQFSRGLANKPAAAPWTSSNSLFGIWMGVNDIGNAWYTSNPTQLISNILDDYFEQVEILFASGARDFVFLNVPPTDRTPSVISSGADAVKGLSAGIAQWNTALASRVSRFRSTHSSAMATLVDTQKPFNDELNQGGSRSTCYNADGTSCLWYNDYHPGITIQNDVARAVAAALPIFFRL